MRAFQSIREVIAANILLRSFIVLYLVTYLSIAHLSSFLEEYKGNQIELAEEKEMDSKEKEGSEENEKENEFLTNRLLPKKGNFQKMLNSGQDVICFWKQMPQDIPTPPPKA